MNQMLTIMDIIFLQTKKITLIEKYKNSEAAILHAEKFENGPNMKPF